MANTKITKNSFIKAFGTIMNAAEQIGVSRRTIYNWIEMGYIPESCTHGPFSGNNWHRKLIKLGINPKNLSAI